MTEGSKGFGGFSGLSRTGATLAIAADHLFFLLTK
jgi:hypothetical protein